LEAARASESGFESRHAAAEEAARKAEAEAAAMRLRAAQVGGATTVSFYLPPSLSPTSVCSQLPVVAVFFVSPSFLFTIEG